MTKEKSIEELRETFFEKYKSRFYGIVDPECEEVIEREEGCELKSRLDLYEASVGIEEWEKEHKKRCQRCAFYPNRIMEDLFQKKINLEDVKDDEEDLEDEAYSTL